MDDHLCVIVVDMEGRKVCFLVCVVVVWREVGLGQSE